MKKKLPHRKRSISSAAATSFSKAVDAYLVASDLTQAEFAKQAGISPGVLTKILFGRVVDRRIAARVMRAIGMEGQI